MKKTKRDLLLETDLRLQEIAQELFMTKQELEKKNKELERFNKELERSNKELEEFALAASHDLREPIRKIIGFTQVFSREFKGKMDENSKENIGFITEGAQRMRMLIDDILEFSRVGRAELTLEMVSFNDIVKEALDNLQQAIKDHQAKIQYNNLPILAVHKIYMIRLFQNLIENAIKYRKENVPPEITITAQKDKSKWLFSVRDNSIGIEKEFHQRIFIIFQRLHPKDKYPGTGMGLTLCQKIVERHGGRIWVESQPGQGSTFKFTLS